MSKVIWKYEINKGSYFELELPKDAEILTVQAQNNFPMMWALVNQEADKEVRKFATIGTGHEIPDSINKVLKKYIGTYQIEDGFYVFHVFEFAE